MLRNDDGEWIEDDVALQQLVNSFYKKLFSMDRVPDPWF